MVVLAKALQVLFRRDALQKSSWGEYQLDVLQPHAAVSGSAYGLQRAHVAHALVSCLDCSTTTHSQLTPWCACKYELLLLSTTALRLNIHTKYC
jgi:hypothetical protein